MLETNAINFAIKGSSTGITRKCITPQKPSSAHANDNFCNKKNSLLQKIKNILRLNKLYFKTAEEAVNYANEKAVRALKTESPYEHNVIIEGEKILKEIAGDNEKGIIKGFKIKVKLYNPDNKIKLIHGHPTQKNGVTPGISFQDFESLNKLPGLHQCTALNYKGQHSILTKGNSFKELSKKELEKLNQKFYQYLFKSLPPEEKKLCMDLAEQAKLNPELSSKIDKILNDQQLTESGIQAVHKFWVENAGDLNLKYETNYDCFT